VVISLI